MEHFPSNQLLEITKENKMNTLKIFAIFTFIFFSSNLFCEEENVIAQYKTCEVKASETEVTLTIAGGPLTEGQLKEINGDSGAIKNIPIQYNKILFAQTILRPDDNFVNGFYLHTLIPLKTRLDIDTRDKITVNFITEDGVSSFDFEVFMLTDEMTLLRDDRKQKEILKLLHNRENQTVFFLDDRNGQRFVGRIFTNEKLKEACALADRHLGSARFTPDKPKPKQLELP